MRAPGETGASLRSPSAGKPPAASSEEAGTGRDRKTPGSAVAVVDVVVVVGDVAYVVHEVAVVRAAVVVDCDVFVAVVAVVDVDVVAISDLAVGGSWFCQEAQPENALTRDERFSSWSSNRDNTHCTPFSPVES